MRTVISFVSGLYTFIKITFTKNENFWGRRTFFLKASKMTHKCQFLSKTPLCFCQKSYLWVLGTLLVPQALLMKIFEKFENFRILCVPSMVSYDKYSLRYLAINKLVKSEHLFNDHTVLQPANQSLSLKV